MKKKGQAAMEFLMTYGWAILVVIAAIAALAYFGVLSPQNLVPERTTFQAPMPNIDKALVEEDGSVEIAFRNNVGVPINVTGVRTGDCDTVQDAIGVVNNGQTFLVTWACEGGDVGQRFSAELGFEYINTETTQTRRHTGTIDGKYE